LLYRYNPQNRLAGKNPLTLDSKETTMSIADFQKTEQRTIACYDFRIVQFSFKNAASFLQRSLRSIQETQRVIIHSLAYICGEASIGASPLSISICVNLNTR
jgi:hypothetical protein